MKSYDSPGSRSLVIGLMHRKETGLRFPICVYRCSSVVELYCYGEELCVIPTWYLVGTHGSRLSKDAPARGVPAIVWTNLSILGPSLFTFPKCLLDLKFEQGSLEHFVLELPTTAGDSR